MPRTGYKSITIKDEDFEFFKELWEKQKTELRKQGVTTFSGFVTMKLYEALELDEKRTREG